MLRLAMAEHEPPPRGEQQGQADRTLLGVAPPRIESSAGSPTRSPVFVRSGTSVAEVEPPPVPRMALPSRPPPRLDSEANGASPAPAQSGKGLAWASALLQRPAQVAGRQLPLWQVLVPGLVVAAGLVVALVSALGSAAAAAPTPQVAVAPPASGAASTLAAPVVTAARPQQQAASPALDMLKGKAPETLRVSELLQLAEGRVERERTEARALHSKLAADPALGKDKSVQAELFRLAADADTAREALATIAQLPAPLNADLLYEVWVGTAARNDTTELARALVYSTDVKPQASAALAVALELRGAESCEQFKVALPKALKDADRRALPLLTKLKNKRGCGPKKTADCFTCLRDQGDELTATINAVKSRRPPSYPTQ
jgi:hypothetical protein